MNFYGNLSLREFPVELQVKLQISNLFTLQSLKFGVIWHNSLYGLTDPKHSPPTGMPEQPARSYDEGANQDAAYNRGGRLDRSGG